MTSANLLQKEMIEESTPSSIEIDNSEEPLKEENLPSPISHVASAPVIASPIEIPTMNESSTMESSSLGKKI